jgi:tetratricopeptide (TPR) repeat protein
MLPVMALVILLPVKELSANPTFGARLMPGYTIPLGNSIVLYGLGGAAAFDFMPVDWFGVFVQGEYMSLAHNNVKSSSLIDGSLGTGFVWRPVDRWSFRADVMGGLYSVSTASAGSLSGISAGARLAASYQITPALSASLQAAYRYFAYAPEPFMSGVTLGASVNVSISDMFNPEPRVSVSTEKSDPVFPVFYSWYDDNQFAVVKVTNNEKTAITDITTSFYLEEYMGQPKLCSTTTTLKPGESCLVPLRAFFSEGMLAQTEKADTDAKVIVEYRVLGAKRRAELPVTILVCDRNAMNWDDDRRAAAFVSSKDPAALWFSKYVSSIVKDRFRAGVNRNMQYAMGLFESLQAYGINYVVDPSSSYSDNVGSSSIDFLQYPYQTLMYRGGDCDDLSILFCSLLEAIGVKSAFVTIPGHIFIEFYSPTQLIYKDGHAWVPLEITLTKDDFTKAWKIGAKEWNDAAKRGGANLYPMEDSWKVYKPVSVPGAASRFNLPEQGKTVAIFDKALDTYVEREIRPQVRAYQARLAVSDTPAMRNRFGILYGKFGMLKEAKQQFILAARKGNYDAWVNLGNVAFMEADYVTALNYYNYVLSQRPDDAVALLGAARCYYEEDEFQYSDALYAELGTRDVDLEKRYSYLGSFFDNNGRAWSYSDRLATTTWCVSRSAASEPEPIIPAVADENDVAVPPPGSGNNLDPEALLAAADAPKTRAGIDASYDDPFLVPEGKKAAITRKTDGTGSGDDPNAKKVSGGLARMLSVDEVTPSSKAAIPIPVVKVVKPPVIKETASVAKSTTGIPSVDKNAVTAKPVDPLTASVPVAPVVPAAPVVAVAPAPVVPAPEPAKAEIAKVPAVEPAKPVETAPAAAPVESAKTDKPVAATEPVKEITAEDSKPVEVKPVAPEAVAVEPTVSAAPVESVKVETAKAIELAAASIVVAPAPVAAPAPELAKAEIAKAPAVEPTKPVETEPVVAAVEPAKVDEPVETIETVKTAEPAMTPEPAKPAVAVAKTEEKPVAEIAKPTVAKAETVTPKTDEEVAAASGTVGETAEPAEPVITETVAPVAESAGKKNGISGTLVAGAIAAIAVVGTAVGVTMHNRAKKRKSSKKRGN